MHASNLQLFMHFSSERPPRPRQLYTAMPGGGRYCTTRARGSSIEEAAPSIIQQGYGQNASAFARLVRCEASYRLLSFQLVEIGRERAIVVGACAYLNGKKV